MDLPRSGSPKLRMRCAAQEEGVALAHLQTQHTQTSARRPRTMLGPPLGPLHRSNVFESHNSIRSDTTQRISYCMVKLDSKERDWGHVQI